MLRNIIMFFQNNEKTLVKSLVYGLISGLFFSLLFVQRTKLVPKNGGDTRVYDDSTIFEYVIEVLRTSILISIAILIITILYLYFKKKK